MGPLRDSFRLGRPAGAQARGAMLTSRAGTALLGRYASPCLLVVVALVQRYLMHNEHLDPWKGGGFGMFSAASSRNLRQMTVTLVTDDGEEVRFPPSTVASRIPLNGDMRWFRHRLLTMPYDSLVRDLAGRLAAGEWLVVQPINDADDDSQTRPAAAIGELPASIESNGSLESDDLAQEARPTTYYRMKQDAPKDTVAKPAALTEVRVEVWQYDLDRGAGELRLTKLASATAQP